ncbi:hypothetical protein EYC80_002576 [Monilinia laxa]|uniref:Pentacotripeptide-repeat region of PRORP domain-containing protein n=1 Tax=Monilinia laxa TaxID=61186 RepID=A0A5N6K4B8_MONLA|nr:hypothetical protein EYC80_002576 [Monilinia laxa]
MTLSLDVDYLNTAESMGTCHAEPGVHCRSSLVVDHHQSWHSKATFNSLIGTPQSSANEQHEQHHADSSRGFQGGETRNSQALPRRQPATRHATKDSVDALESMFEEALKQQSIGQPVHVAELSQQTSSSVKSYEYGEQFKKMLKEERPLGDCWSFFVEHFGPAAWRNGSIVRSTWPASLKSGVPSLLRLIRDKRKEQPFQVGLTTVKGQELLSELLMCWNIVCRRRSRRSQIEGYNKSSSDWSKLTRHTMHSIFLEKRNNGTQYAFSLLTPQFPPGQMYQLPTVALATLSLLLKLDSTGVGADTVQNAQPLISRFSSTIKACAMNLGDAAVFFRDMPESVVNLVRNDWSTIKEFNSKQKFPENFKATENERAHSLHKRVSDAFARRDVAQLDRLWSLAQKLPVYHPTAKDGSDSGYRPGHLTPAFYNYFILVFMSLKQQSRAIDVWNHMVKSNLTPDIGAWDALLNGCKMSRDPKALEQVWAMMIESGEAPDVNCWTTRISGLIHCYKADDGIRALDEMGRLWLAAIRKKYPNFKIENSKKSENSKKFKDVTDAVRPTIATINAAVSGLLKMQKIGAASRILAWADQWGIIPDVKTYNTLLGSIVRAGHIDKTPEILTVMEGQGVQADAATFVTVLEQTFADIDTLTPEEQIDAIYTSMAK